MSTNRNTERARTLAAGPITITGARFQRGWSADDRGIDDSPFESIIGTHHASLAAARRAADAVASREFYTLTYTISGQGYRYDSSYNAGIPESALFTSAEIESFATDLNVAFTYALSLAQADWTRRQCFAIESRAAGEIDHERFLGLCEAASSIFRVAESDAHDLYDTLWTGLYALPIRESEGSLFDDDDGWGPGDNDHGSRP